MMICPYVDYLPGKYKELYNRAQHERPAANTLEHGG